MVPVPLKQKCHNFDEIAVISGHQQRELSKWQILAPPCDTENGKSDEDTWLNYM